LATTIEAAAVFRNKLGSGHVSKGYDRHGAAPASAFADLARGDAGGWLLINEQGGLPPEYGVHFATMRQIGWELEQTLRRHCGDLIAVAPLASPVAPKNAPSGTTGRRDRRN
jgi:hypothetical protein